MGDHVEQARSRRLGERLEVAAPDCIGIPFLHPDVIALVVHRALLDEVDRADRVVEPALVDEVLGAILGAQDEVDLEAKPKRRRADELAIGDEIVVRLLLPERVTPQLERLGEPVDVLGDAELVDAGLASGRQVPLDVPVGERGRVRRLAVGVLAQVDVVIGEHGAPGYPPLSLYPAACSGTWRSSSPRSPPAAPSPQRSAP